MKDRHPDIDDDEIRVIESKVSRVKVRRKRSVALYAVIALFVIIVAAVVAFSLMPDEENEYQQPDVILASEKVARMPAAADSVPAPVPYTIARDTVANEVELTVLTPLNSTATLEIGAEALDDTTAVLIAQAADIRGDNGKIVGSCIVRGELVSKGEAKTGFCSIVNGVITVGVADATPMFEQALTTDGFFFRQYPLVVGGQIVENKPKGQSIRKALAVIDGRECVIYTHNRVTFHDFSQALADIGVENAIYLVGGDSYGLYKDAAGDVFRFGDKRGEGFANVNFMVWR